MKSLQPEASIANIEDGSGSVAAARDGLTKAGAALVERAAEIGLAEDVAALYRSDPLEAEGALRDMVFDMTRTVLADAFAALDGHGPSLEANGGMYRKAEVTPGRAMTMFGPVDFLRSRYRPSGTGASVVPAEAVLGLTACGLTPAAAGLSMYLMSGLTARESEDAWRRLCGQGPSTASLVRLSGEAGSRMEACSGALLTGLREREEMPAEAVSLLVSLDEVMMRLCCGQGYVAERSHRPATHGNPPSGRNIIYCSQSASRKAISPLSSFQGRSGPSSAASHSAIALAFVSRSISA